DDRHSYSRTYIEARLAMMMGGRAAEKIIYNHYTTGASNDIERATEMARRMICEWGMSDALGPVAFGKKDEEVFLGREIATSKNYSENTAVQIDAEIKRIVSEAENKALSLIEQNIQTLHNIANALVERETIDSEELDMILKGQQLPPLEILNNGQSAAKIEAPVA
ncbi:MAG TPA: cell division protein FtsH, partial [bacterium]|nr:cell division protein FtsH [bacterium]